MVKFNPMQPEPIRKIVNERIDEILSSGFEQSEANELVRYTFRLEANA
jgi:hypothetical protein